ncbi:PQQ-binding-like beta-propeller repeat protein [Lentzea sp. NPDC042327]|uniref:outer membrane protein assembly factor BamB family protein n=1 Tax=Lentzea sp. NPDC042327 TaxID=3154801 RepID=UPI00340C3A56
MEPNEQYDFALSFAGPDRVFARGLAEALKADGHRVFFDEYHQAELWGTNLFEKLLDVYGKRSRYVVVVVSRHYLDSVWTRWELRSALETVLQGRDDAVLPLRLDDTELPGLPRSTAWIDVREDGETDVELLTRLLAGKLAAATPVRRRRVLALGLGGVAVAATGTYFGTRLFARAEPGSELWHRGFESACFPVVNGADVVLSLRDGGVVGLGQDDGAQRWRVDLGGAMTGPCSVVRGLVLAGRAMTQNRGRLTAIEDGGAVRWSLDTDGLPACHREARDGTVLVGTNTGWVLRVDERSGQVVEQVRVSRQVNDVVEQQGFVYSATAVDGVQVHADGKQAWSRTTAGAVQGLATDANHLYATVGITRQGASSGQAVRYDAITGELGWQHSFDALVQAAPVVVRGQLVVSDIGGTVHSLDVESGAVRWQQNVGAAAQSRTTWDGDALYVGTRRGLAVLDVRSGAVRWTKDVTTAVPTTAHWAARPVLGDRAVFLGYGDMQTSSTNGDLYALVR